jgi:hypothetical protein
MLMASTGVKDIPSAVSRQTTATRHSAAGHGVQISDKAPLFIQKIKPLCHITWRIQSEENQSICLILLSYGACTVDCEQGLQAAVRVRPALATSTRADIGPQ